MIALSVNRAGTIPVMDMSFHTPIVFVFSVLEINIAIVAASIPIFWPVIATLASNEIFVVNEVQIHIQEASRDSFGSGNAITHSEGKEVFSGRTSKVRAITKAHERRYSKQGHKQIHRHSSNPSTMGLDLARRASQDSQRKLYRTTSNSNRDRSSGSLTRSEGDDWFAFLEMDRAVAGGRTTTTVERVEVPLEQIKSVEHR